MKVLTETSPAPVSTSHPQLALGARQDSPSFPLPIHGEGVPERAGVRFQSQAAMKTNPVAQIISVSTSRPGGPPPGSPINLRGISVFVVPCQSPATARTRALLRTARQKSKQKLFVPFASSW